MKNFKRGPRYGSRESFGSRDSRSNDRESSGRREESRFGDSRRFERRDSPSSERRMHEVTCAKCGVRCEVPFRPTKGKPVYCSDCFKKNEKSDPNQMTLELERIHDKLDKILDIVKGR
jgi:CxxC-x17-CxxC domain-containing protein